MLSDFFFQAGDGLRAAPESRGLGDVYQRQVHALHRAEHSAAVADAHELGVHRFFDELGHFVVDERALERVLVLGEPELLTDDQLDRGRPPPACPLYTSYAADEKSAVVRGGPVVLQTR